MVDQKAPAVRAYRWIVFLLALGYWLLEFRGISGQGFGWQFRYLTIWGLTGIVVTSWLMLCLSMGWSDKHHDALVAGLCVISGLVVFLYWRLYFIDPKLVNGNATPIWWKEYYLHLAGPVLQWVDAVFILQGFRKVWRAVAWSLGIEAAYVAWSELVVSPTNDFPAGKVTNGLPYPFLNDMTLDARLAFYATSIVTGFVILGIGWALARLASRVLGTVQAA